MNPAPPFLGIDFGTFKSCMAWVPPGSDTAEIIKNAEGDDTTPSVLYYGADAEPLVGEAAEDMAGDEVEWERVVTGIKRDLLRAAPLWIDRRRIDPVDAVAAILAKLKTDAERGVFRGKPVTRAVITHPALFDALQRDKLAAAAGRAGFDDVELLEEPVAAALAYERWLKQIGEPVMPGDHILVYDFGGGTFDLAVLAREDDGSFREAMEPEGLHQRGGNDLDLALYGYFEQCALEQHGQRFGRRNEIHLPFLRQCRDWKERLSTSQRVTASAYLPSEDGERPVNFRQILERADFEALIDKEYIAPTVRLTEATYKRVTGQLGQPDKVKLVLIGGATRVPLVERRLKEALPLQPHAWDRRDLAVALGAAYHARQVWGSTAPVTDDDLVEDTGPLVDPDEVAVIDAEPALSPAATVTTTPGRPVLPAPVLATPPEATAPGTIIVDASGQGSHRSITAALQAANPGDTILVRKGTYTGGLVLDKPVSIIGDGQPGDAVLEASGKDVVLFRAATGTLRNLVLRQTGGGKWYGIDITSGTLLIENCDIASLSLACVAIHKGADPILRGNKIHDGESAGVHVYDQGKGTLEDNDIFGNANAGVEIKTAGDPVLRRNKIHDGKGGGVYVYEQGKGTLEDNDIFGNANAGVSIATAGDPILRGNKIHDGKQGGVYVYDNGGGTFDDNDLRSNQGGAWNIAADCLPNVKRARNRE